MILTQSEASTIAGPVLQRMNQILEDAGATRREMERLTLFAVSMAGPRLAENGRCIRCRGRDGKHSRSCPTAQARHLLGIGRYR